MMFEGYGVQLGGSASSQLFGAHSSPQLRLGSFERNAISMCGNGLTAPATVTESGIASNRSMEGQRLVPATQTPSLQRPLPQGAPSGKKISERDKARIIDVTAIEIAVSAGEPPSERDMARVVDDSTAAEREEPGSAS